MAERPFNMKLIDKRKKEYRKANRQKKTQILDQLELDTGYERKSLIRALNKDSGCRNPLGGRPKKYTKQTRELLELIWEYSDYIAAERFHAQIGDIMDDLQRSGLLSDFDTNSQKLIRGVPLGSCKAQISKLPKPRRKGSDRISGNSVKRQIPIRTGFHTNITSGYFGIDFVDHCGGRNEGRFARTLCAVDPKTTWLSRSGCFGKDRVAVEGAWEKNYKAIPYPLRGLHSDNEPNLLYTTLRYKARKQKFLISRTRAYKKEDNGHVEQKNGDKVRKLVGYKRYEEDSVEILNKLYKIDDLFQNHFVPSMRLKSKEYDELGKATKKIYEKPATAYERVMSDKEIDLSVKIKLASIHNKLDRVELKQERDKLLRILFNSG